MISMQKKEAYTGFTNKKYKPKETDFVAEFRVEPARGVSFKTSAEAIAGESSVGTWTDVCTSVPRIRKTLAPTVVYSNPKTKTIRIAYPGDLFEEGNIPQLMSSIAGNVFGMKIVNNLRLEDINFPDFYIKSFKGPAFGIPGIRSFTGVEDRPLVGTIIKPKLGLNEKEHAKAAYNAWLGGCDIVKDDENLSSMKFNNFEKRIKQTLKMRNTCEKETGEVKIYMPNVTAPYKEMVRRAKFVREHGGDYMMVDVLTVGWSALQELRNENLGLIIHAHRAGHAAFTRSHRHGISMLLIAKLCRLIGVDQLHIGAIVGKMEGGKREVQFIDQEVEKQLIEASPADHVLKEDWLDLKPVFAVASGGVHPGKIPAMMKYMGNDIIIQAGGGVHGHPNGSIAGAKAMRQAVSATMHGVSLEDFSKANKELAQALKKWKGI